MTRILDGNEIERISTVNVVEAEDFCLLKLTLKNIDRILRRMAQGASCELCSAMSKSFVCHGVLGCNSIFNIIAVIVNAVSPICMATCPRAAAVYLMQPIFWSAVTTHAVSYPVRSGILQSR